MHTGSFTATTQNAMSNFTTGSYPAQYEGSIEEGLRDYSGCGYDYSMGVAQGIPYADGSQSGDNYIIYDTQDDSRGVYTVHVDEYTTPDGRAVDFWTEFVSANTYTGYWWDNGWHTAHTAGYLGDGSCETDSGGFIGNPFWNTDYNSFVTGTFDLGQTQWQDTAGAWHLGGYTSDTVYHFPCGGGATTDCWNARYVSSSEWQDNIA